MQLLASRINYDSVPVRNTVSTRQPRTLSPVSDSPDRVHKRCASWVVLNFTRGRSLMSETSILSQWATLEANSGAIFPILRSSRIPQLLGYRANLELPFNIEGADLPTSVSDTKLTLLLLSVRAVSSEGSPHDNARTALRPCRHVPLGCGVRQWRGAPSAPLHVKSPPMAGCPYLIEPYSRRSHSVTSGTRRSAATQSASHLPLQFRKNPFLPKICTSKFTQLIALWYRYWFASFKFKLLQL